MTGGKLSGGHRGDAALPAAALETLPGAARESAQQVRGILLMLLAVALFSVMDALIKWLAASYPVMQLVFFRSLFAFLPLGVAIWMSGGGLLQALRVRSPGGHLLRSLAGVGAMTLFFWCYAEMRLADVIAIGFAAPLFITALSMPLLRERVGPRRWTACLIGFLGVLIMVRPGFGLFESFALVALLATVFYSLAVIYVRKLARIDSSVSIVFYFTLTTSAVSGVLLPFVWVTPTLGDLLLLIIVGLLGGLAQIAMTQAFRSAEVALVMPFEYSAMFWATAFGWLVWGEVPSLNIWIGCAIVVAAGIYIVFREARLGKPRGLARRLQVKR